ncbi:hypothetical protein BDZ97DRAFT_1760401 [Flammula alnicola]|nr:hypothetical protein BDZ97DRAFT_1760401 [Flammula alnicola]
MYAFFEQQSFPFSKESPPPLYNPSRKGKGRPCRRIFVFGYPIDPFTVVKYADRNNLRLFPEETFLQRSREARYSIEDQLPYNNHRMVGIWVGPTAMTTCVVIGSNFNSGDMERAFDEDLLEKFHRISCGNEDRASASLKPAWYPMMRDE